tara:strand:+ start:82 stop:675 length:594 start_codon:yes stop_codon:yes gene_type:complete
LGWSVQNIYSIDKIAHLFLGLRVHLVWNPHAAALHYACSTQNISAILKDLFAHVFIFVASFVSLIIIMLARSFLDLSAYHTGCLTTFSHFAKHWRGVYVEVTPSDLGYVGPFGVEVVASFGTGATRGFFERDVVVLQRTTFCQTFVQRIRLRQLEDASFKQLVIPAGRDCIFCATENQSPVNVLACLSPQTFAWMKN